jgi:hypothetical protein
MAIIVTANNIANEGRLFVNLANQADGTTGLQIFSGIAVFEFINGDDTNKTDQLQIRIPNSGFLVGLTIKGNSTIVAPMSIRPLQGRSLFAIDSASSRVIDLGTQFKGLELDCKLVASQAGLLRVSYQVSITFV